MLYSLSAILSFYIYMNRITVYALGKRHKHVEGYKVCWISPVKLTAGTDVSNSGWLNKYSITSFLSVNTAKPRAEKESCRKKRIQNMITVDVLLTTVSIPSSGS